MTNGTENLGNGAITDERFAAHLGYRGMVRRDGLAPVPDPDDTPLARGNGSVLGSLSEPVLDSGQGLRPDHWLESAAGQLADHPLLRGLLLELPPKGAIPDSAWLDRWFEAARAILELIYTQPTEAALSRR